MKYNINDVLLVSGVKKWGRTVTTLGRTYTRPLIIQLLIACGLPLLTIAMLGGILYMAIGSENLPSNFLIFVCIAAGVFLLGGVLYVLNNYRRKATVKEVLVRGVLLTGSVIQIERIRTRVNQGNNFAVLDYSFTDISGVNQQRRITFPFAGARFFEQNAEFKLIHCQERNFILILRIE